ncbi:MAG: ATP-dependent DNA helicase RecQ [Isosphaeraceae bacterium]
MATEGRVSWEVVRRTLREQFGFRTFREGQARAVRAAIDGRDTVVLMPTGSGKSLCYQLPALALPGVTVVVSPLIALMKDQADALAGRGIRAVTLHSGLSADSRREAEEAVAGGHAEFVFTTPERLANAEFRALLGRHAIDLFVVDEAHCISHWGHDFRPEYLDLGHAIDELGRPPVLALTATATSDVLQDIAELLRLDDPEVVHTGFDRPNIDLAVAACAGEPAKRARLLGLLRGRPGPGIVYAATVKAATALAEDLGGAGLRVGLYHGRMKATDRATNQDRFMAGELDAIVATNAFGLGIDKSDIRFVAHYQVPGVLEAYYQEFGRAGRDGEPAMGVLLYDPADSAIQRFFRGGRYPSGEDLINAHHTLKRMEGPATLAEVQEIAPLPKARMRAALALFEREGVAGREAGRFALLRPDLDTSDLERLAGAYRDRAEEDVRKQRKMIEYAESLGCRWRSILDEFEGIADPPRADCGHCDRCDPGRFAFLAES